MIDQAPDRAQLNKTIHSNNPIPRNDAKQDNQLTDEALAALGERTRQADSIEPRAAQAHYLPEADRFVIQLRNGVILSIPRSLLQGFQNASPDELAEVEVTPSGYGLHWERLDQDFTVPGLAAGIFGTHKWMASQGGAARSEAKSMAARANGRKGGRPRNIAPPE